MEIFTTSTGTAVPSSGITYYRNTDIYEGDVTKNCSLTAAEIDGNFHFLRGMDIRSAERGDGNELILYRVNGCEDVVDMTQEIDFDGTEYDADNGVLKLVVNGSEYAMSGFTACDCAKLAETVDELADRIDGSDGLQDVIDRMVCEVNNLEQIKDDLYKRIEEGKSPFLIDQLHNETKRAEDAEEALGERIDAETERAEKAETALDDKITKLSEDGAVRYDIEQSLSEMQARQALQNIKLVDDLHNMYEDESSYGKNTFGERSGYNLFRSLCSENVFGTGCINNSFGVYCVKNNFGDDFQGNVLGNDCYLNVFAKGCKHNTFGIGCRCNRFGLSCLGNSFGANCTENVFPDDFDYNIIDSYVSEIRFSKDNNRAKNIHILTGVRNVEITVPEKYNDANRQLIIAVDGDRHLVFYYADEVATQDDVDTQISNKAARYDGEQSLQDSQKEQARANIDANVDLLLFRGAGEGSVRQTTSSSEGRNSVALGEGSAARNDNELVAGKYNAEESHTICTVGIGNDDGTRRNALVVKDDGTLYIDGVGNYAGTNSASDGVKSLQRFVTEDIVHTEDVLSDDEIEGLITEIDE